LARALPPPLLLLLLLHQVVAVLLLLLLLLPAQGLGGALALPTHPPLQRC
jgi:hypothetical protein